MKCTVGIELSEKYASEIIIPRIEKGTAMTDTPIIKRSIFFLWHSVLLDGGVQGMEREQTEDPEVVKKLVDAGWKYLEVEQPANMTIKSWLPIMYNVATTATHAVIWRNNITRFIGFYPKHPDTMAFPVSDRTERVSYWCLREITPLQENEGIVYNGKDWFIVESK
jgi:hypothetical protein